jgi:hypothetical protein
MVNQAYANGVLSVVAAGNGVTNPITGAFAGPVRTPSAHHLMSSMRHLTYLIPVFDLELILISDRCRRNISRICPRRHHGGCNR